MKKRHLEVSTEALASILIAQPNGRSQIICRGEQTGTWLSVLPSTVHGTELSAQEFGDAILLWYGIIPPNLPATCNGCEAGFILQHALGCKKGGLVIFQHNEIQDELVHLAAKSHTPFAICDKPLICPSCIAENMRPCPTKSTNNKPAGEDNQGDILL